MQRVHELTHVTVRNGAPYDAVLFRPVIRRKVIRTEHPIDDGEVRGKVAIVRPGAVMPAVKLWRHEKVAQRTEPESQVRVIENPLERRLGEVDDDRCVREPQNVQRDETEAPGHHDVHDSEIAQRKKTTAGSMVASTVT
jgi:hypothetical protein